MSKLHSIEVSKIKWKLIIWIPIIVGAIIFAIFNSTFYMPSEYTQASWYAAIGFLLVGFGFGLVLARMFKIEGIDK